MDFMDRAVLVTGSTRGIGRATAEAFLEAGARVAINGRTAASVEAGRAALSRAERTVAAPGDMGTVAGCEAAVAAAVEGLGGLDVLVNSAGVYWTRPVAACDEADWDAMMDVNLKGTFFATRAALPALRQSGAGAVVNLASDAGLLGYADSSLYCASKAGVIGLTRALALELVGEVRVNCVCPGWVDTDMADTFAAQAADPAAARREMAAFSPLGRMAKPREIARAILFLASADAAFITGIALPLDGGETAGR
jgi:NAD(P)-dependent dehydrogenase (short-subunit alcohol dehydrogenase family)